ncbi:hypothetical protein C9374_010888 [Naegleria lovaniensis]|uniref:Endonuclease/exonuclease/phosphatase domain-containing protein n=1 Tax=Naegleria lovaniensis TaxID=51637 RepID=A0AA88GFN2_NAELO|nr:uncharacterized protein C9374_010888 [Naegleria lovaniensis]KAG2374318.1 hypothetical protein C9374_010888 [Naegleria lovaniensis]
MAPKRKSNASSSSSPGKNTTPSKKKKKDEEVESEDEESSQLDDLASPAKTTVSDPKELGLLEHSYDPDTHYKFISFNVNGISALMKKENYIKLLGDSEKPYCICLQETKLTAKNQSKFEKILPGYTAHFNHCVAKNGYSGTAVFTLDSHPPVKVSFGMGISKHDNEGRLITVEYEDVYLVNTYVPNSGQKLERLDYRTTEWDVDMLNYLKKLEATKPVVWTGDLNVAVLDIDVHNPKGNKKTAGFTDQERKATPIVQHNFIDSFRLFHPQTPDCYTYWGYRFNMRAKNKGWRLDYFICSQSLKENIESSYILSKVLGSDHCPISLVLKKPKKE